MEFEVISVSGPIQVVRVMTEDNIHAAIIKVRVDTKEHKNICVFQYGSLDDAEISDESMLCEFARTQKLPVYISYPLGSTVEKGWLVEASTNEIDTTIWKNYGDVDVYKIVEP